LLLCGQFQNISTLFKFGSKMKLLLLATLCFVTIHVTMARHFHHAKNPVNMDENMIHKRVKAMIKRDYLRAEYDYLMHKRGECKDDGVCASVFNHFKKDVICKESRAEFRMMHGWVVENCRKSCKKC